MCLLQIWQVFKALTVHFTALKQKAFCRPHFTKLYLCRMIARTPYQCGSNWSSKRTARTPAWDSASSRSTILVPQMKWWRLHRPVVVQFCVTCIYKSRRCHISCLTETLLQLWNTAAACQLQARVTKCICQYSMLIQWHLSPAVLRISSDDCALHRRDK